MSCDQNSSHEQLAQVCKNYTWSTLECLISNTAPIIWFLMIFWDGQNLLLSSDGSCFPLNRSFFTYSSRRSFIWELLVMLFSNTVLWMKDFRAESMGCTVAAIYKYMYWSTWLYNIQVYIWQSVNYDTYITISQTIQIREAKIGLILQNWEMVPLANRAVSLIVFYLHFCQNWDMHIVGIVRTCSISSYTLNLNQK